MKDIFGHGLQLLTLQRVFREFRAKVNVQFERGHFLIKTVQNGTELEQVLRLRYEVFHRELLNKKFPFGMDVDRFDAGADHLVIIDKRSQKIVGTYRFLSTVSTQSFYSETEFCLYEFLRLPGTKLELSRACIHRDYRTGVIIHLLWRGLVDYINQIGARYLFGLASVKTMDMEMAGLIYRRLEAAGVITNQLHIHPVGDFRMYGFAQEAERLRLAGRALTDEEAKDVFPPLFNAYLKAGAKVYGTPAIDRDFRCIDFLTVLDMEELTQAYERKYVPGE